MFGRKLVREQDVKDAAELEKQLNELMSQLADARGANLEFAIMVQNLTAERDAAVKKVTDMTPPTGDKPAPLSIDGVPRRCRVDLLTPLENKVRAAFTAIEHSSAHPLLTAAGVKVQEALELIADYVEKGEKQ